MAVKTIVMGENEIKHQTVTIMVGVSASGKTTRAHRIADKTGAVILSRDTLREQYFPNDGVKRVGFPHQEKYVTFRQRQLITHYLLIGKDIVIDDTNLVPFHLEKLVLYIMAVAKKHHLLIEFKFEMMYDGNLDEVRQRNYARLDCVPDDVVVFQDSKWRRNKKELERLAAAVSEGYFDKEPDVSEVIKVPEFDIVPYVPDQTKPKCLICDIDGTVARAVKRDIYYSKNVITDSPRQEILDLLEVLSTKYKIVFVSGRKEEARYETEVWLRKYFPNHEIELYMRNKGDSRPDDIVKYELFNQYLRNKYNVCGWFDDRHRVSRLIEELGVPMFFVGKLDYEF